MAYAATRTVSGTADTPTTSDDGGLIQYTSASGKTITLTGTSWVAGRSAFAARISGGGTATFVGASGVTVNGDLSVASGNTVVCQYTGSNTWEIVGTDVLPVASGGTGATTVAGARRNLSALGPVFDVTAYGAVGNGSTDDTAAIQAAIDAAESARGAIYFPAGDYLVNGNLVAENAGASRFDFGMAIYGEGQASRIQVGSGSGVVLALHGPNWTIRDLAFRGNNVDRTCLQIGSGTDGGGAVNTHVRNIFIDGERTTTGSGHGIAVVGHSADPSHATNMSGVKIYNVGGNGVDFGLNTYDAQVSDLWVGHSENCVNLHSSAGAIRFSQPHLWGARAAGMVVASDHVRVTNGYIETNASYGIDVSGVGFVCTGVDFWQNEAAAIRFTNAFADAVVSACVFRASFDASILMHNCTRVLAVGCRFAAAFNTVNNNAAASSEFHVEMTGTSDLLFLEGCVGYSFDTTSGTSVKLSGRNNRINGCDFHGLTALPSGNQTITTNDFGRQFESASGTSITVTVSPDTNSVFPLGTRFEVMARGAGSQLTVAAGAGVTINNTHGLTIAAGGVGVLIKRWDNLWEFYRQPGS